MRRVGRWLVRNSVLVFLVVSGAAAIMVDLLAVLASLVAQLADEDEEGER